MSLRLIFALSSPAMVFLPMGPFSGFAYLFSDKKIEAQQILSGACQLYSLGMSQPTKAVVIIEFSISQYSSMREAPSKPEEILLTRREITFI